MTAAHIHNLTGPNATQIAVPLAGAISGVLAKGA